MECADLILTGVFAAFFICSSLRLIPWFTAVILVCSIVNCQISCCSVQELRNNEGMPIKIGQKTNKNNNKNKQTHMVIKCKCRNSNTQTYTESKKPKTMQGTKVKKACLFPQKGSEKDQNKAAAHLHYALPLVVYIPILFRMCRLTGKQDYSWSCCACEYLIQNIVLNRI